MKKDFFSWNPWHGCRKVSAGCLNCYVYRIDGRHGKDSSVITRTENFGLPLHRKRDGKFKIPSGTLLYTCFSSDFLIEEADAWRPEAWKMMRLRKDVHFLFITKRIDRLQKCVPPDWGDGYENVTVCCTIENQERADYRLPIYKEAPIKHKIIICEPLLEEIVFPAPLEGWVEEIIAGGESGPDARPCDYKWILSLREQCIRNRVGFRFKQTGARFIKEGRLYRIPRPFQSSQARKADIDYHPAKW